MKPKMLGKLSIRESMHRAEREGEGVRREKESQRQREVRER